MEKMGTTQNALGVYSIVASLQYLRYWVQADYWPWYKHSLLGVPWPLEESSQINPSASS